MSSIQSSGKNAPTVKGLENGNGTRSVAGLVVAGLVTVAGSWIGMAAYMDYRLQSLEDRLINETKQQVVSIADTTRTTFNTQLTQVNDGLAGKIENTASTLARGIIDIKQTQTKMANEILTGNVVAEQIGDLKAQIQSFITEKQGSLQNEVAQLAAKIENGNQTVSQALEVHSNANRSSDEALLTALQNLGTNLGEVNTGLLARMDTNAKSLEDLVKNTNENNVQLLYKELSALAEKVTSLNTEFSNSQTALRELNASVPEWQKSSQEQLAQLTESNQSVTQDLQSQMGELQTKFNEMDQQITSANESLMRALYVTSEGMEGAKIEIKSELENSKQVTSTEIHNLVQNLQDVSKQIESIKQNISTQTTGSQSSALPFPKTPEFEKLVSSLQSISLKTNDLRTQIDSRVKEVQEKTETWLGRDDASEKAGAIRDMLLNYTSLAEMAGGKLDTLIEGLQNIGQIMESINGGKISQERDTAQLSPSCEKPTEIGMNPEDRTSEAQKDPAQ